VIALRKQHAAEIIVAAPVVAADTCEYLQTLADTCKYIYASELLYGVGLWYDDFSPVTDAEVRSLLETAARTTLPGEPPHTYQHQEAREFPSCERKSTQRRSTNGQ